MKPSVIEAAALAIFIALGGAGIWAAGQIGGFAFDPLGSAAVPYTVSIFVVLLSLACLFRLVTGRSEKERNPETTGAAGVETFPPRDLLEVVAMLGFTIVYVIALFAIGLPFSLATLVFVPASARLIARTSSAKGMTVALAVGAIVGFGGELLFTKVFFVDLPALW